MYESYFGICLWMRWGALYLHDLPELLPQGRPDGNPPHLKQHLEKKGTDVKFLITTDELEYKC